MILEEYIVNYLSETLDVLVDAEIPEEMHDEMIVVFLSSHYKENYINYATIVAWVYGDTKLHAAMLNEQLQIAMEKIIERDEIFHCSLENSFSDNETDRKRYRYRSEFDVVF